MQTPPTLHNPATAARFVHHLATHPKVTRHARLREAMITTRRTITCLQASGEGNHAGPQLRGLLVSLDMTLALPTAPPRSQLLRDAIDVEGCARRCSARALVQRVDALRDAARQAPEVVRALYLHAPLKRAEELAGDLLSQARTPRPKRQFHRAIERLLQLLRAELPPREHAQVLAPFLALR